MSTKSSDRSAVGRSAVGRSAVGRSESGLSEVEPPWSGRDHADVLKAPEAFRQYGLTLRRMLVAWLTMTVAITFLVATEITTRVVAGGAAPKWLGGLRFLSYLAVFAGVFFAAVAKWRGMSFPLPVRGRWLLTASVTCDSAYYLIRILVRFLPQAIILNQPLDWWLKSVVCSVLGIASWFLFWAFLLRLSRLLASRRLTFLSTATLVSFSIALIIVPLFVRWPLANGAIPAQVLLVAASLFLIALAVGLICNLILLWRLTIELPAFADHLEAVLDEEALD
jgi:hypothetical protein